MLQKNTIKVGTPQPSYMTAHVKGICCYCDHYNYYQYCYYWTIKTNQINQSL